MAFQDDVWAMERMRTHKDLTECSSFRVEVDGVIHRVVRLRTSENGGLRWQGLCSSSIYRDRPALHDDRVVNCIECIAEGA